MENNIEQHTYTDDVTVPLRAAPVHITIQSTNQSSSQHREHTKY